MYVQLLNIGFVKQPDGTYVNSELSLRVAPTYKDDKGIYISTPDGKIVEATVDILEEAIMDGRFGVSI